MTVLDAKLADVMRGAQQSGELDEEFQAGMHAIYTTRAASTQLRSFRKAVGVKGLATPPRPPTTDVQQILEATPTCVYFTAIRHLQRMVAVRLEVEQPYYLGLERNDPNDRNPTAWKIGLATFYPESNPERRPAERVCEVH